MIRDGNRNSRCIESLLHNDMAASLPHLEKAVPRKDAATSRPDRTRSLPNLNLKARHKHFRMAPSFDLGGISRLKEEFDGLL